MQNHQNSVFEFRLIPESRTLFPQTEREQKEGWVLVKGFNLSYHNQETMDQEDIPPSDRAELLRRMARMTKQHARRFRSKSEPRNVTSGVSDWLSAAEPWADAASQTET